MNKKDPLVVDDCTMIKWEDGSVAHKEHSVANNLPFTNKRCSPVSVITSPPCQPRTPPPHTLQCAAMASATTTITTATSVLIKSESTD